MTLTKTKDIIKILDNCVMTLIIQAMTFSQYKSYFEVLELFLLYDNKNKNYFWLLFNIVIGCVGTILTFLIQNIFWQYGVHEYYSQAVRKVTFTSVAHYSPMCTHFTWPITVIRQQVTSNYSNQICNRSASIIR